MIVRWNGSTTLPRPREQQRAAAVLKTSRHRWVNFLYFYMLRTSELRSHCSIVCAFLAFVFIQMCLYLSRGHQYSGGYNCVCFCSVSFAIALGTSLLCCLFLCLSFRACSLVISPQYPWGYYLSVCSYVCFQCPHLPFSSLLIPGWLLMWPCSCFCRSQSLMDLFGLSLLGWLELPNKGCPTLPILQFFFNIIQNAFNPPPSFWEFGRKYMPISCPYEFCRLFWTWVWPPAPPLSTLFKNCKIGKVGHP